MENLKILLNSMLSNTAIATVIIPGIAYPFLTAQLGLWVATIILAVYCLLIDLKFRVLGNFAYLFLLFGVIDIAITLIVPKSYLSDALSIQAQVYAVQSSIILIAFMVLNKPIPMLLAEAFAPPLKDVRNEHGSTYISIFKTISIVWAIAYLVKAALFLLGDYSETAYSIVRVVTGWPLVVSVVYFSIAYSRKQFEIQGLQN
ncbi:hypothetical protein ACFOND_14640 [Reinekea marina]|uniref:Intracellular septation protein A n=1 Tax=Reinekea marina TaxID=1310421 RepID=A0ABV7WU97_9GAMM